MAHSRMVALGSVYGTDWRTGMSSEKPVPVIYNAFVDAIKRLGLFLETIKVAATHA